MFGYRNAVNNVGGSYEDSNGVSTRQAREGRNGLYHFMVAGYTNVHPLRRLSFARLHLIRPASTS